MLNGCVSVITETVGLGTRTNTLKVGYISQECFAFVYGLLCVSRQIPGNDRYVGIMGSARATLRNSEKRFQRWFEPNLASGNDTDAFANELSSGLFVAQDSTAMKEWRLRQLRSKFDSMDALLKNAHGNIRIGSEKIMTFSHQKGSRSLKYLLALELRENVSQSVRSAEEVLRASAEDWRHLNGFAEALVTKDLAQEAVVVRCPLDNAKLRVPNGKGGSSSLVLLVSTSL